MSFQSVYMSFIWNAYKPHEKQLSLTLGGVKYIKTYEEEVIVERPTKTIKVSFILFVALDWSVLYDEWTRPLSSS